MKILLLLLAIAIVLVIGLRLLFGHFNIGSQNLRADGKLQPCPDSPNCHAVSVELNDAGKGIEVMSKLMESVRAMSRSEVKENSDNYLHVVYTSALLGYKDDLECLIETTGNESATLHCRSASRVGYSDFDINRKRIDQLLDKAGIKKPF